MVRHTFAGHARKLEENCGFTYAQSQLHAYSLIETYFPELFGKIKKLIAENRWEVVGGQWVEPGETLVSSEALARQFLYGQKYCMEHFGKTCEVAWSPDDSSHSFNMPQLYKLAGLKYLVFKRPTRKIFFSSSSSFSMERH